MVMSRRGWFKRALQGGSAGLALASGVTYLKFFHHWAPAPGYGFLDEKSSTLIRAIVLDLAGTAGSLVDAQAITTDVDAHLTSLPAGQQADISTLLRLLTFPLVSRQIGFKDGVLDSLEHPHLFLERLRSSSLKEFRIGYRFLVSVTQLHFFKYAEAWPLGYTGLPEYVKTARFANAY